MKKFLFFLFVIASALIGILFVLDFSFTHVYENAVPRTKFQLLRSLKNKKVDYIFLGSSRVENGIIPELIMKATGKSAINLGFQASKMSDIYIVLKLLKEYNIRAEKIAIQVDYIYNIEDGYSNVLLYELMPFINENKVTQEYFKMHFQDQGAVLRFPFYRYCTYESKIGFREFTMNLMERKSKVVKNYGFVGLQGNSSEHHNSLPGTINKNNKYFEKIKSFSETSGMKVLYFCAPFCRHTKNLKFVDNLKMKIPDLYDFSRVLEKDELFQNCSHLNKDGAVEFTECLIRDMIQ